MLNITQNKYKSKFLILLIIVSFFVLAFFVYLIFQTKANVVVTPASGGTNISADKASNAASPAWTNLGNIVVVSGANNDFAKNQSNVTLILTAPNNWSFNPGIGTGSVSGNGITFVNLNVTSTNITFTFTRNNKNSNNAAITISGIQVRANDGSLLPSSGNILRTSVNPGTAIITGIVNNTTNFGSLSQTFGVKNKLALTQQPSTTATVNTDFTTKPIIAIQDQFGNTITTDNTTAVNINPVLSTQTCGGTPGSGLLTSIPASGATVTSGIITYTSMKYSAAESIKICASSGTLSPALSNTIMVSSPPNNPPVATIPSSISQYTDGSGYVNFQTTISDPDSNNTKLKIEYSPDGGTNWYKPYLYLANPSSGTTDLNNSNTYQIGTTDTIDTSSGPITLSITWDTKNPLNGTSMIDIDQNNYQIRVTPNDGTIDGITQTSANFQIDNLKPVLSFNDNVEIGPVINDIISGNWGDSTTRKWMYNSNTICSLTAGSYPYDDTNPINQSTETNNGKFICLYGSDAFGNINISPSTNPINIDATPPSISFTDNIEIGPVTSDTITPNWGDAVVKRWKYNSNNICSLLSGDYPNDSSISMNQINETNNNQYICLYAEDGVGNKISLASNNPINIDITNPVITINAPTKAKNSTISDTTINVTDNNGILASKVTIDGTSTTGSNLVCIQAGSQTVNCTVDIVISGNLVIKAIDNATNSITKAENGYVVSNIAPAILITAPTKLSNTDISNTTINITDSDGIQTTNVSVDASSTLISNNFNCIQTNPNTVDCTINITTSGNLVIKAIDNLNNPATQAENGYIIDSTNPVIVITAPTKTKNNIITDTTISITDNNEILTANVTIDGSTTASTNNFSCSQVDSKTIDCTIDITSSGNLVIKATDNANNSVTQSENGYIIDMIGPDTIINSNPPLNSTSTDATFTFSATEASVFECQIDGNLFAACTSPLVYNGLSYTTHTFEVRAIDLVGNIDLTPASYTWTISIPPPPAPPAYTVPKLEPIVEPTPEPEPIVEPTPIEPETTPTTETTPTPEPIQEIVYGFYVVQKGDSLYSIAAQLGTTREKLIQLNSSQFPSLLFIPDTIYRGWVFKYEKSTRTVNEKIYVVKSGDSLSLIAGIVYGNQRRWMELVNLNKDTYPSLILNPNIIIRGWQLKY